VVASFVGSSACATCHVDQAAEWQKSQHAAAMAEPNASSVLGDFRNARFTYAGTTSEFYRRAGKFFVRTDGRDGRLAEFEIAYTFGVYPLQQYLVAFPDGRLQALSIAWDARPRQEGGQRWFHLYGGERVTYRDELHWTRPFQNWNFMCADCHSTAVRKNYDAVTDRFSSTWSEITVGCEACHGPGSEHLAWTKVPRGVASSMDASKGLSVKLDERRTVNWSVNASTGNAVRSRPRTSDREMETCAQCHSRRRQIAEGYSAGKPFLDYYRPALLTRPLYHPDGQQRDEVYNWGSFAQSKMYAAGVTCSDCHDPHSGKLRAQGNATCATCHLPSKYDTPKHHNHNQVRAGAACASCHMPSATYMVVDPRHDHSLRVPRPDLSVKYGTPNACTDCHTQRDARWAAARVAEWFGAKTAPDVRAYVAAAFGAAADRVPGAQARLWELADDRSLPDITRASALVELDLRARDSTSQTLARNLNDPSPLIRLGALQSAARLPPEVRAPLIAPLLFDSLRALRMEAANLLAGTRVEALHPQQREALQRADAEFIESQRYNADRADARVNLGTFLAQRGDGTSGEAQLRAALKIDSLFFPAYVNLADLYRIQQRDADGERLLRSGIALAPRNAALHHALGLSLVRMRRLAEAVAEFGRAATLDPTDVRFSYVYAVALHSSGNEKAAIARLEKMLLADSTNTDVLSALMSFHRDRGDRTSAERYARQLRALSGAQ
jgi:Tfp pilus assembly protein PilF